MNDFERWWSEQGRDDVDAADDKRYASAVWAEAAKPYLETIDKIMAERDELIDERDCHSGDSICRIEQEKGLLCYRHLYEQSARHQEMIADSATLTDELQERLAIKEDALNASQLLTQRLINRIVTQKEEISGLKECIDYMCTQIEYDTNNAKKIARTHAARECIEILWAASNCDETITFEELVEEIKVRFGIGDEK